MFKNYLKRMYIHIYRLSRKARKVFCENLKEWIQPEVHRILMKLKVNIYSYLYISLHGVNLFASIQFSS